jgi:tripartite-type tricarboxylate transporter receptor subunit TctC
MKCLFRIPGMRFLFHVLIAAVGVAAAGAASAQSFPSRPIRILVPFAPGGTTDTVARTIGAKLSEVIGQPVIVENRAGGGTIIGTEALAHAAPDGYTIMLATPDFTINPSLHSRLPYDTAKDFSPIALVATYPMVLVANADHNLSSVRDVIAQAQSRPGKINFASAGNGSMPHLCGELLNSLAHIELAHVPYKGNGPALTDLLAGHVSLLFSGAPIVSSHVKSGKLKMLAVSTVKRHPTLPDVPTLAESGVPGYDVTAWFGFIAPAGVPKEVIAKLNANISRVVQDPEIRKKLDSLGADLSASSPEAFAAVIKDELGKWGRVIHAASIKVD